MELGVASSPYPCFYTDIFAIFKGSSLNLILHEDIWNLGNVREIQGNL